MKGTNDMIVAKPPIQHKTTPDHRPTDAERHRAVDEMLAQIGCEVAPGLLDRPDGQPVTAPRVIRKVVGR